MKWFQKIHGFVFKKPLWQQAQWKALIILFWMKCPVVSVWMLTENQKLCSDQWRLKESKKRVVCKASGPRRPAEKTSLTKHPDMNLLRFCLRLQRNRSADPHRGSLSPKRRSSDPQIQELHISLVYFLVDHKVIFIFYPNYLIYSFWVAKKKLVWSSF